jgi:hypothetical protein
MNTITCNPCIVTDATLDVLDRYITPDLKEDFATRPIQAIQAGYTPLDEETLHMSFEEAISGRIVALGFNRDLSRVSMAITEKANVMQHTTSHPIPAVIASRGKGRISLLETSWQRHITYFCLALIFMLMGFDFMGLLILHVH